MFPRTPPPLQRPYPVKPPCHVLSYEQTCKTGPIFRLRGGDDYKKEEWEG